MHDLYVIAGPIFNDTPDKLPSSVSIPISFYKIFAYQKGYGGAVKSVAFILPQNPENDKIMDQVSTVDGIKAKTGINFFPELSAIKQNNLESKKRDFDLNEKAE